MAKDYAILRAKMSPESRARAEAMTQEMLAEMPLNARLSPDVSIDASSKITESLRDDMEALHEAGAIGKATMREFDAICPPLVRP